jgi:hypothetical protein
MQASPVSVPERPGKSSVWTPFRATTPIRYSQRGRVPDTQPLHRGNGSLDPVRAAFWQAYRHLFPPHALAAQTDTGALVISWSVLDDPNAKYPYAAPVMIRFDEHLTQVMARVDARQRLKIAHNHEATLREGMRGYDPYARVPNARVVNLG